VEPGATRNPPIIQTAQPRPPLPPRKGSCKPEGPRVRAVGKRSSKSSASSSRLGPGNRRRGNLGVGRPHQRFKGSLLAEGADRLPMSGCFVPDLTLCGSRKEAT